MSYDQYLARVYLSTVTVLDEQRLEQLVARNGIVGAADIIANSGHRPVDWELEACRTLDRARTQRAARDAVRSAAAARRWLVTGGVDDPGTVVEMVNRAARADYERWAEQVERCGRCARPVRLRGRIIRRGREVYSTDAEPDGVLFVRCRNRRASVCPSCSYEYAGDMWRSSTPAPLVGGRMSRSRSGRTRWCSSH